MLYRYLKDIIPDIIYLDIPICNSRKRNDVKIWQATNDHLTSLQAHVRRRREIIHQSQREKQRDKLNSAVECI